MLAKADPKTGSENGTEIGPSKCTLVHEYLILRICGPSYVLARVHVCAGIRSLALVEPLRSVRATQNIVAG